ncbi:hypothetical protein LQ757_05905 [Agromyces sp. SYSU K20354]|uniref:hypothetical protein n=1 Tax=Agromyces cavernae TaxID=2898659 RepID=UPI001E5A6F96|nr:hypothetical protein [Agromyces cavernae]MCD2441810.1 hypothetical protein [Agromyces cavernae]
MAISEIVTVRTDAGMLGLWCPAAFSAVDDYDSWETHVNERLLGAIATGDLVPLNIGSDGAWGVRVTSSAEALSDRECPYEVVTSEPYLLVVSGGEARLSGIEYVGLSSNAPLRIPLAEGRYAVRSTIVAWDEEPGALGPDGRPSDDALTDIVVQILPEDGSEVYRTDEVTFDPPE